jgi:hypothetical protein
LLDTIKTVYSSIIADDDSSGVLDGDDVEDQTSDYDSLLPELIIPNFEYIFDITD